MFELYGCHCNKQSPSGEFRMTGSRAHWLAFWNCRWGATPDTLLWAQERPQLQQKPVCGASPGKIPKDLIHAEHGWQHSSV